jgi:hypothetical protein
MNAAQQIQQPQSAARRAACRANLAIGRERRAAQLAIRHNLPYVAPTEPTEVLPPMQQLYREEKARKAAKMAGVMAGAQEKYLAMVQAERDAKPSGRPRRLQPISCKSDPLDALIHALNGETVQR